MNSDTREERLVKAVEACADRLERISDKLERIRFLLERQSK